MDLSNDPQALSVLFVAPECAPLVKTGGLGDVCGALPAALRAERIDARVLVPGYPQVLAATGGEPLAGTRVLDHDVRFLKASLENGAPLLVLDCPELYAREGGPYVDPYGKDWPDNAERFGVLSAAAALLCGPRSPVSWRPRILHCNDWQSALAPVYLERAVPSVLTIHNMAFQGNFDASVLPALRLPPGAFTVEKLEFYGKASFLKGGIVHADAVTTVSPRYAREIQTPEFGCGMEGVLRSRGGALTGILNGIEDDVWNPASDRLIAATYDSGTLEGKRPNKAALQKTLGLEVDASVPLFGTVGRMTHQKGTDLILAAAPAIVAAGQLAIIGSGDRALERAAVELAARYPGRVAAHVGFSEALAHLLEAGADVFLMPSRFEPCGLNQMYSQRYGTPPVARATGGLADTIEDGVTGFLFDGDLVEAVGRALACYREPGRWRAMQRAAMSRDFSWGRAARRYAALYSRLATPQPA